MREPSAPNAVIKSNLSKLERSEIDCTPPPLTLSRNMQFDVFVA